MVPLVGAYCLGRAQPPSCLGHDSMKNLQPKRMMDDRPLHLVGIVEEIIRPSVSVVSVGLDKVVQFHIGIVDATSDLIN